MEVVYECKEQRLRKDFRHTVVAKDQYGNIVGTYYGFWNPGQRIVALYPDYNHPAHKPGRKLVKKKVYDGYVRCTVNHAIVKTASSKQELKGETFRNKKMPMQGQETMNF